MMGYIPKKIKIYSSGQTSTFTTPNGDDIRAIHASMADPMRPKEIRKAKDALVQRRMWKDRQVAYEQIQTKEVDNKPQKGLRVISMNQDFLSIATKDNLIFTTSAHQTRDLIWSGVIEEGGFLRGEYIIARVPYNGYLLVRVGSSLYKSLAKEERKYKKKKIPNKDLVVGQIYENRYGPQVFLGWVSTTKFICGEQTAFRYYKLDMPVLKAKYEMKRAQLWWEYFWYRGENIQAKFDEAFSSDRIYSPLGFKVISSHSVTKKLTGVITVPKDIITQIKTAVKVRTKKESAFRYKRQNGRDAKRQDFLEAIHMMASVKKQSLLNMGKTGTDPLTNIDPWYVEIIKKIGGGSFLESKDKSTSVAEDISASEVKATQEIAEVQTTY